MASIDKPPVLIVGAGPTGLTAANLLGRYGIATVLVEAKPSVNRRPRSTFVDDEFFRVLGTLGLADEVRGQSLGPATYEHYSPLGFLLSREEGQITAHNYPTRSAIFQPWFDQTLLDGARRFDSVRVLLGHELVHFEDNGEFVNCTLRDIAGDVSTQPFSYVLAADGARSPVREALGIEFEAVTPLEARSLRVDIEGDPDRTLVMRSRPGFHRHAASFPSPNGRRYSFSVKPGEDAEKLMSDESLRQLIKPFHDLSNARVINRAVYTFRTRVAARFRKGRVFLLGDAAHVQPPAGSQGMNGGARDAHNLAWKIAAVVREVADPSILDTYEEERYTAARELVSAAGEGGGSTRRQRSVLKVATRDILRKLRSWVLPNPSLAEELASASHLLTGQATALKSGVLVGPPGKLLGRVLPNPWVEQGERGRLLDSLLGHEFALLAIAPTGAPPRGLAHPFWASVEARTVILHRQQVSAQPGILAAKVVDDRLDAVFAGYSNRWLIVRPDRIVAAIAEPNQLEHIADEFARLLSPRPAKASASVAA